MNLEWKTKLAIGIFAAWLVFPGSKENKSSLSFETKINKKETSTSFTESPLDSTAKDSTTFEGKDAALDSNEPKREGKELSNTHGIELVEKIKSLTRKEILDFLDRKESLLQTKKLCEQELCYGTAVEKDFSHNLKILLEIQSIHELSSRKLTVGLADIIHHMTSDTQKTAMSLMLDSLGPQESIRLVQATKQSYDPYAVKYFFDEVRNRNSEPATVQQVNDFLSEQSLSGGEISALVLLKELHHLPELKKRLQELKLPYCKLKQTLGLETQNDLERALYVSIRRSGLASNSLPSCS